MKKITAFIAVLLLAVCFARPAYAEPSVSRVYDDAGLLSYDEYSTLVDICDQYCHELDFDFAVAAIYDATLTSEKAHADYCDQWWYSYNFGCGSDRDGVMLLLNMADNWFYVYTQGYGLTAITDWGRDQIMDSVIPYLREGDYYDAFETFARLCRDYVIDARNSNVHDTYVWVPEPETQYGTEGVGDDGFYFDAGWLVQGIGLGILLALIVTSSWKSQLKSVKNQYYAGSYVKENSLNVSERDDRFMYTTVSKTPRPKPEERKSNGHFEAGGSTVHTSSSGHTHGGGGGHF